MNLHGTAASRGIAIGKLFLLDNTPLDIPTDPTEDVEKELNHLTKAVEQTIKQLQTIRKNVEANIDEEHAKIFDAHIQIANDPELTAQVTTHIKNDKMNAAHAWNTVANTFVEMFLAIDNEYMRERAADIKDVTRRLLANLLDKPLQDVNDIQSEVILVAEDLAPSDTAQLNTDLVQGFITKIGGRTSHSAIMARTLEIPAVVGVKDILEQANNDAIVILDGYEGNIILEPSEDQLNTYRKIKQERQTQEQLWQQLKDKPSVTNDGKHIEIAANIGNPDDVHSALEQGAEGIGLYRTEFLYMNSSALPTETEQYDAYKTVLAAMKDKKVVIRTLDIGGDKHLPYLPLPEELNPFLGQRALRLCLEKTDIFKTQLRALLRASVHGNLHIMFPMVATLNELRQAKTLLEECKQELKQEGHDIGTYKVGIMVEIPSVAMLADQFAKEVDFFSIGTNDLIQYTFAADRMNDAVSYLYQPYNPSLLRLIKNVIDASHKEDIWTGMCGEMASDPIASMILLGLGLDEFSMSASSVLQIRYIMQSTSYKEMVTHANNVLQFGTHEEVKKYMQPLLKGGQA